MRNETMDRFIIERVKIYRPGYTVDLDNLHLLYDGAIKYRFRERKDIMRFLGYKIRDYHNVYSKKHGGHAFPRTVFTAEVRQALAHNGAITALSYRGQGVDGCCVWYCVYGMRGEEPVACIWFEDDDPRRAVWMPRGEERAAYDTRGVCWILRN